MTTTARTIPQVRAQPRPRKWTLSKLAVEFAKYSIVIVLALSYAFPLYWMVSSALKDDPQVYRIPPVLVPNPAHWNNFIDAWRADDFTLYTFNSIFRYALPSTVFTVLSSSIVAYGFSRVRWPGRDQLFYLCIATMMVPYTVTMVPLFIIFKKLGWVGTYNPMVVPALFGNAFFIFMLRQFFLTLPQELSDAARVDGASELGILFRIILPLSRPALAVVALFQFMGTWNDYLGPLIYINKYEMFPLALGIQKLRQMLSQVGNAPLAYPYLMAVSTIAAAPIILLFFFAQRTFIEGISLTGLKG
ncbi:MAG: carbohydrate ABC transporter permease [Anaerolineae bacterium]|nr:carbohydrate ABC transporter permease [Anaerolineae bacterium]MDW8100898.1 carbohydrate ABC transporter permease [Anaerolineae bacterium]